MSLSLKFDADLVRGLQILRHDPELALGRGRLPDAGDGPGSILVAFPVGVHPSPAALDRLAHEYGLRDELDAAWAARPLDLLHDAGRTALALEDPGGEPLDRLLHGPMEIECFLPLALGMAWALGKAHQRGLIHKDVKPANFLVNCVDGGARLTGFGIASRLPRERPAPEPPEVIAGTLAYMAPEQTGRMNRSIDSRSDLYALGVSFYRMLTGALPFAAADPMEWVHCHIARKPMTPSERLESVPAVLSRIVIKLLAKTAEDRYQTAAGIEHDLRRCLAEWERHGRIEPFALGERDRPDRLMIPEKLYGREREVEALLAAFDRVVESGAPELVLVSGYSGVGKSSVVNELHKALVLPRGLFASGKFDQLKRDVPYATLAQAFQSLVRSLLSKREAELSSWRDALCAALEPNGRLIVDFVPELALVIGVQPPVPDLEPQQAKGRFQFVMRRFIEVFAKPEHPLALFLDDLQWLDAATLDFLEDVLIRSDLRHLLLIGAYRDNEVDDVHPLTRKLSAIREAKGRVSEIKLGPLVATDVRQLIADALGSVVADAAPLAELVQAKTAGNPFFVLQFLQALADEGLLAFDHEAQRWSWDLDRIHAKGYADNVVDLMVGKLAGLEEDTREALQQLACLGSVGDFGTLGIVLGTPGVNVHGPLWDAVRLEVVERLPGHYRFVHDRVREAAYSLIPEEQRAAAHLRIGRLLIARTPPQNREEAIFEIVNQLNRGATLIASPDEREHLAELNLVAGKRAKAAAAYASALKYLVAGATLLSDDRWERQHELAFALEVNRAECEFLTGELEPAEGRLSLLSQRVRSLLENATVTSLRMTLYPMLDRTDRAVEVGLEYLRAVGVNWSPHPTREEVRQEYDRLWRQLGSRPIGAIADLPRLIDPGLCATLNVLMDLQPSAGFTDPNLRSLVVGRMANLSLEYGNDHASCHAYVWVGLIVGAVFGDYRSGFEFGKLGLDLVEKHGLDRFKARVYLGFGVWPSTWGAHFRTCLNLIRLGLLAAQKTGDLTYEAFSGHCGVLIRLAIGEHLADVQREAEIGLQFARKKRFGLVVDILTGQLRLIRTLRGLTPSLASFDDADFTAIRFERHLDDDPRLGVAKCWYWLQKLQALFHAGDYPAAAAAASQVEALLPLFNWFYESPVYHFYAALVRAALHDFASANDRPHYREALRDHYDALKVWADCCPENFENRATLVSAEIARIEGRALDAMDLYEQAIRLARDNGFVHNEALANELAARFYAARGLEKIAQVYLRDARYGYLRWGADGKVQQLDEMYPHLREAELPPGPTSTIGAPVERLDLATVIKVLQAASSEIVFEKLIDTLMRTAIEQAGAERGLLALAHGAELRIAAEAATAGDAVLVHLRNDPAPVDALPESIVNYVQRTRESVILDHAAASFPYAADPYIRQRRVRSVLCLPLLNQAKLTGVLYLENNLATGVFAPARIAVLKLLASQAAISIENTRLYRELAEREAEIRRLVDANIIGIFTWRIPHHGEEAGDPVFDEVNDAFLRMLGYDREEFVSGRMRRSALTPPEWQDRDAKTLSELRESGVCQPFEKEYFRKDGSRLPVLMGSASLDQTGTRGVAFVLDLTDRKRAEAALRRSEAYLAQSESLSKTGSWAWKPETGEITHWSQERYRLFGFDPAAGVPSLEAVLQRIHPEDREVWLEIVAGRVRGGNVDIDCRVVLPDGEIRRLHVAGHAVFSRSGDVVEIVSAASDVTELKRAEASLRESEEQWKAVFENNPTMYFMVDSSDTILSVNPFGAEQLGYTPVELAGRPVQILIHEADREFGLKNKAGCLEHLGRTMSWELRKVRKDGSVIWARETGRAMLIKDRPVVLIVSEDITEAKRAAAALHETQTQLAHANRLETMGQLTASIAHEVNQPIAATIANAQTALRWLSFDPPDLDRARKALDRIVRDGAHAGEVVQRIRALTRKGSTPRDRMDINAAIREVIELTHSEAMKNGVLVRTDLTEILPPTHGDRVELQQVILNLILNAVEAMADGETPRDLLIATAKTESGETLVSVHDTGPGLATEVQENLFRAFYTTKPSGLGLGLSICRSIVESHGGHLWASANAPRGAVFQFTLPAHPDIATGR